MLEDVARAEAAERELDAFVTRRALKARNGRERANEEAASQRERDDRHSAAVRLVNAKAWAAYYGGLALASHDAAARYAEKRDEALALIRELTGERG